MTDLSALIEGLEILATYGNQDISIHSDCLWVGPDPEMVSEPHRERLEELGFSESEHYECFTYET